MRNHSRRVKNHERIISGGRGTRAISGNRIHHTEGTILSEVSELIVIITDRLSVRLNISGTSIENGNRGGMKITIGGNQSSIPDRINEHPRLVLIERTRVNGIHEDGIVTTKRTATRLGSVRGSIHNEERLTIVKDAPIIKEGNGGSHRNLFNNESCGGLSCVNIG